jgi:hypothetical protein
MGFSYRGKVICSFGKQIRTDTPPDWFTTVELTRTDYLDVGDWRLIQNSVDSDVQLPLTTGEWAYIGGGEYGSYCPDCMGWIMIKTETRMKELVYLKALAKDFSRAWSCYANIVGSGLVRVNDNIPVVYALGAVCE